MKYVIYTLRDSRSNAIRFVGCVLQRRFPKALGEMNYPSVKRYNEDGQRGPLGERNKWYHDVRVHHARITYNVIETTNDKGRWLYWIGRLRNEGAHLTNSGRTARLQTQAHALVTA